MWISKKDRDSSAGGGLASNSSKSFQQIAQLVRRNSSSADKTVEMVASESITSNLAKPPVVPSQYSSSS